MSKKRRGPRAIVWLLFLIVVALVGFFVARGVISRISENSNENSASSRGGPRVRRGRPQDQEQQFAVTITAAIEDNLSDYIKLTGDVVAQEEVEIFPEITGRVTRINVDLGQSVGRGQTLAVVDASRPGQTFAPSPVRAQITGTVTQIYVDIGDTVSVTQPLAQISDTRQLYLKSSVAERYVSKIAVGREALIRFEAFPGEPQRGYISEVSPVIDTRTRTQEITIAFSERNQRLRPGMFGSVQLITEIKERTVQLPADCVVNRFGKEYVFVVRNDESVEQREVAVGINVDNKVEILSGLQAGEQVVYKGQTLLEDGVAVRVVDEVSPLNISDDR